MPAPSRNAGAATEAVLPPLGDLVHEWDEPTTIHSRVGLVDETIRDGLQSPRAPRLDLDQRYGILDQVNRVGIGDVIIGMLSERNYSIIKSLLIHARDHGHQYLPWVLIRARSDEFDLVRRLRDELQMNIGLNTFMGSSRLRMDVEGWSLAEVCARVSELVDAGRQLGFKDIRVAIEDATRAFPDDLCQVISVASRAGATRLCLADTFGGLTPSGVVALVSAAKSQLDAARCSLEWHGHNDFGLATANSLAALGVGAQYVHGTICGVGERNGNCPIEVIAVLAAIKYRCVFDWSEFDAYAAMGRELFTEAIAASAPFFGPSTFESSTGTHIAAIGKAKDKGRMDVARILFSPPSPINDLKKPVMLIGPNAGRNGVAQVLAAMGLPATDRSTRGLMAFAETVSRALTDDEIRSICNGGHQ